MKYIIIFLLILIVFILSSILGAYNNQLITINYLIKKVECPLSILITLLFTIGFVLGCFISSIFYIRLKFSFYKLKKNFIRLKEQINKFNYTPKKNNVKKK